MDTTSLGDRMKMYERQETFSRFVPGVPVIARIDGRSFSRLTKGLERPYDRRFSKTMIDTLSGIIKDANPCIGYTQSDEINLVFYTDNINTQIFFDGKKQKLTSVLASIATSHFIRALFDNDLSWLFNKNPSFDCRVFSVPTKAEAVNYLRWREKDATKNSISMAASEYYSHKELMGKTSENKQEMLWQKGVNWNNYPSFFKRGTYMKRSTVTKELPEDVVEMIPKKHRPESRFVKRTEIKSLDIGYNTDFQKMLEITFQ